MPRRFLICFMVLLLVGMPAPVFAEWSGAQTVTWERDPAAGWVVIYTTTLDYAVRPWWRVTGVADVHPIHGADADVSTTLYLNFGRIIFVTTGVRAGIWESARPPTPYFSISVMF